jgi:hypothetical protein
VYPRFKSAIDLSSKRSIDLSRIRVHPRPSAVQKSDRPFVKKIDRPFPHPRPSACICGSKERSTFPPSASISVYLRFKSAIALSSKRAIDLTIELSELSQVKFNQEPPNH